MRVPLRVESLIGSPKPVLYVTLRIPRFHIFKPVKMFIDTGSSWNIISERDSQLMGIPFSKLHQKRSSVGVGGGTVIGHLIKNAVITFRNEKGKLVHRTLSKIYAIRTMKRDKETRKRVLTFPSVLGVDFLIEHKFKLIFDPVNRIACLEEVQESSSDHP